GETGYKEAEVQSIWSGETLTPFVSTSAEFGIRIKELGEEKLRQKITEDIKGVLDKEGLFAGIDFTEPTIFNLKLQKPAEEVAIQKMLEKAGYNKDDVESLFAVNQTGKEFLISIKGLDDIKKRIQLIDTITESLKNNLVFRNVKLSLGDIVESLQSQGAGMQTTQVFIEAEAGEPIDTSVLTSELAKQGFRGISVASQSNESSSDRTRKLKINGSRAALQEIKERVKDTISLPGMYSVGEGSAQVALKEGISKKDFIDTLIRSGSLKSLVKGVYLVNAPSQAFAIQLQSLSAGKIQEKIKDDVMKKFENLLYKEKIDVSFEEIKDASAGTDAGGADVGSAKTAQFRMALSKPLKKVVIEEALTAAGYSGVLESDLDEVREYQT
ncbi:MAG: hypothetical protein AAB318_05025, partial [Planctomycetota bacterium]